MLFQRHIRNISSISGWSPSIHSVSQEEKIISTLEVTGIGALIKIYDKMTSGFEFTMKVRHGRKTIEKKFDNKEKLVSPR